MFKNRLFRSVLIAVTFALSVTAISPSAHAQYSEEEWCIYFFVCTPFPAPAPVLLGDEAEVQQQRYYVRSGDLNGDGVRDFLVTGADILRRVQDFVVLSNSGGYQPIDCFFLSASQQSTVANWPILNAPVSRVDISLDGYFDFVLQEVVGGESIAVITNSTDGRTPMAAVVIDSEIRQAAWEIQRAIQHPQDTLTEFNATYTYWIEYWAFIPVNCFDYSNACGYWFQYWVPYNVSGSSFFTPAARDFIQENTAALTNGSLAAAFTSTNWTDASAITGLGAAVISSPIAMRVGWFALSVAIMGTGRVVAAGGRPLIVGVLVTAAAVGIWHVANEVYSDAAPSDTGPMPTTTTANPDPFEPCDRDTSVSQVRPDDRPPWDGGTASVESLRSISTSNLNRTGCVKPANAQQHHGIPLRAGRGGAGDTLRLWARNRGINLAEEANQIHLPNNTNVATRAISHTTQLHEERALLELNRRLLAREAQGLSSRDALRTTLEEMARGTFTW